MNFLSNLSALLAQIEAAPDIERLRALSGAFSQADSETMAATLEQAARFCADCLVPLNRDADRHGCVLQHGRVRTAAGHAAAWQAYVDGGWPTLDQPPAWGGQGLPTLLVATVQHLVDGACPAFCMLPVLQRSAARLLAAHGDEALQAEWLPHWVRGDWGATICISEAGAGSDVGRIRTLAEPADDGHWLISGEKMWISFGDHDLTPRIGHCLLARTPGAKPGHLSLFLVPDWLPGPDGQAVRNNVQVRRLEEKLGLHGSPTCALGFEGARGWLIGSEGKGLAQLFVMIANMRLSAGMQGLGIAAMAADVACAYAAERRQGGRPDAPPPLIAQHADVQRQLLEMVSRVEVLRGLGLAIAVQADLAEHSPGTDAGKTAAALTQWLLPIFKTSGGEIGFDVASDAIQVLGGAGYTREWPVEQALRDARVATIYEGTTGIQGLDLLHRRLWRDGGVGMKIFLARAHADLAASTAAEAHHAKRCFELLEDAANRLQALHSTPREAESGATAFLQLAALAALGWIALRLAGQGEHTPAGRRLRAAGRYYLSDLAERAALAHAQALRGAAPLALFADL
ncbi:MAG: hypothetical protein JWP96_44 [Polaromonas sp.]|nr:hypothetical protein [Polaromonas sp.]